jgi:hypothetical protein
VSGIKGRVVKYDRRYGVKSPSLQLTRQIAIHVNGFTDCGRYHPPKIVEVGDARLPDWSLRLIVQTGRSTKIKRASRNNPLTDTTSCRQQEIPAFVINGQAASREPSEGQEREVPGHEKTHGETRSTK